MEYVYSKIVTASELRRKLIAVLIDPGKLNEKELVVILNQCKQTQVDFIFLGGSLISQSIFEVNKFIKSIIDIPVVLFPGSLLQMDLSADALLLLSMLSGRNPELLIGNHIQAAPLIKKSGIESISTAYLLIEGGLSSSVEYISNTKPIPREKSDIAVATSIAAELLGFKLVYLEAGSGAKLHVPTDMISQVRKNIKLPIIVGGGIRKIESINRVYEAGADLVVIGTAVENHSGFLNEVQDLKNSFTLS